MKIRAVFFDMDGVLIEAKEWHYEALNRALKLFGMPISRYDHLTTFDGLPTLKKLELLSLERDLPKELHLFINEMKQKYTMEIVASRCKPTFIHEYALSSLKSQGYILTVCSNSVRNSVEIMMQRAALSDYLDLMISNEDVSNGKPDPEMYLQSMNKFSLNPTECLILEDNENGIKAARDSGAHLMVIKEVTDVNLTNILNRIREIESGATT
tara:strand:+ start:6301 stop:6936 length:636 start_codon:yes stop_codon:yes gene_type:complete